jgi:hypothetical protein
MHIINEIYVQGNVNFLISPLYRVRNILEIGGSRESEFSKSPTMLGKLLYILKCKWKQKVERERCKVKRRWQKDYEEK